MEMKHLAASRRDPHLHRRFMSAGWFSHRAWRLALLAGTLAGPPAAADPSSHGTLAGFVGSDAWFRSMRQSAANQAMLRMLAPSANGWRTVVPPGYVEVAGRIQFPGGVNPFRDGRLPDLRIVATDRGPDDVERAPTVSESGTFYTVLRQGLTYEVRWMYYFGAPEAWAQVEVGGQGARQLPLVLTYATGAPAQIVTIGTRTRAPAAPDDHGPPAPVAGGQARLAGSPDPNPGLPTGDYGSLPFNDSRSARIAAARDSFTVHHYVVSVPPGVTSVVIHVDEGSAQLDLAVKPGSPIVSVLEGGDATWRDFGLGMLATCVIERPAAASVYVDVVNRNRTATDYTVGVQAIKPAARPRTPPAASALPPRSMAASAAANALTSGPDAFDTSGLPDPPQTFDEQRIWEAIRSAESPALKAIAHRMLADYYGARRDERRSHPERQRAEYWRNVAR